MIECALCGHELMDIVGVLAVYQEKTHVRMCNNLTPSCGDSNLMPFPPELLGLNPVLLRGRSRAYGRGPKPG